MGMILRANPSVKRKLMPEKLQKLLLMKLCKQKRQRCCIPARNYTVKSNFISLTWCISEGARDQTCKKELLSAYSLLYADPGWS